MFSINIYLAHLISVLFILSLVFVHGYVLAGISLFLYMIWIGYSQYQINKIKANLPVATEDKIKVSESN